MFYFTMENDGLVRQEADALPQELEELYKDIRKKYTIEFDLTDWADDDRDAGTGYCYSNSYHIHREPLRQELVLKDGSLAGFYVGYMEGTALEWNGATEKYLLKLENGAKVYERGTYSNFYGSAKEWILIAEEAPSPKDHVFLSYVAEEDRNHDFQPCDFNETYIESVQKVWIIEDNYGRFNGAFRVWLKLTETGMANPDQVLEVLKKHRPVMIHLQEE